MFENVDGQTDAGVTGILIAHLGAFGSGELIKETDVSIKVRKDAFDFSPGEITTPYIAVTKLKEGYRQIQRHEATSMFFNLQYGHLLDVTFELYAKEKESGVQNQKWDDWLKQNIGISSSISRKLREISRLLRPYMRKFSTL